MFSEEIVPVFAFLLLFIFNCANQNRSSSCQFVRECISKILHSRRERERQRRRQWESGKSVKKFIKARAATLLFVKFTSFNYARRAQFLSSQCAFLRKRNRDSRLTHRSLACNYRNSLFFSFVLLCFFRYMIRCCCRLILVSVLGNFELHMWIIECNCTRTKKDIWIMHQESVYRESLAVSMAHGQQFQCVINQCDK